MKKKGLFIILCLIVILFGMVIGLLIAIAFGFMVVAFNLNEEINESVISLLPFLSSLDLNFLTISIGLGTGLGLSHGIYSLGVI
ncbi:MAG: hypothetical protein PHP11_03900 [Erysipelotrichaceae bacterium]|nr:hypothetical protein [Erysipelotrichaceae bacterium]MDD3924227.1 hypothetical protein [Erysipelotrichaceae bacterium]